MLRYGVSSLLRNGRCEYSVGELEMEILEEKGTSTHKNISKILESLE